jgi:hypothetical protein
MWNHDNLPVGGGWLFIARLCFRLGGRHDMPIKQAAAAKKFRRHHKCAG